jgi:hypothetical protein
VRVSGKGSRVPSLVFLIRVGSGGGVAGSNLVFDDLAGCIIDCVVSVFLVVCVQLANRAAGSDAFSLSQFTITHAMGFVERRARLAPAYFATRAEALDFVLRILLGLLHDVLPSKSETLPDLRSSGVARPLAFRMLMSSLAMTRPIQPRAQSAETTQLIRRREYNVETITESVAITFGSAIGTFRGCRQRFIIE